MRTAYEAVIDGKVTEFVKPKRLEYSTIKHEELIKVVDEVIVVCFFRCDFLFSVRCKSQQQQSNDITECI